MRLEPNALAFRLALVVGGMVSSLVSTINKREFGKVDFWHGKGGGVRVV